MAEKILMPKQGNTVESCVILEWKKKEGDTVSVGDILCEVETDKATFEIQAEHDGVLLSILRGEGDDVPVMDTIAYIGQAGENVSAESRKTVGGVEAVSPPVAEVKPPPRGVQKTGGGNREGRLRISPRARNFALQNGIAVEGIEGSGPGGRILEADVRNALSADARKGAETRTGVPEEQFPGSSKSVTVGGFRSVIARRMRDSLAETAQLTLHSSADARDILLYREKLKNSTLSPVLTGISLGDMVMYAAARVLKDFPFMNAYFLGDTIQIFDHVHLGFATDTPKGLLVPTIQFADRLSLGALSAERRRLAEICRAGKAGPEELAGATFTVTNLGSLGIESFTPVLNPPQVAILGLCSIRSEACMEKNEVSFVPRMGLSLTVDHQAVDGAPAAGFLKNLCSSIADFQVRLAE